jgi:hypothetical protein
MKVLFILCINLKPLLEAVFTNNLTMKTIMTTTLMTSLILTFAMSLATVPALPQSAGQSSGAPLSLKDSANQASYVIIAHPDFVEEISRDFAQWRTRKGYTVRVVSTSDIYREFPNAKSQESLRAFTNHVLQVWQKPLRREPLYFLLVGSADHVPSYRVPVTAPDFLLPSLLAREDSVSLDDVFTVPISARNTLPQATIGRFPVRTVRDVQVAVAKTKTFEDDPLLRYANDVVGVTDARDYYNFEPSFQSFLDQITIAQRKAGASIAQQGTRALRSSTFTYRTNTVNDLTRSTMLHAVKTGTMFWVYYGHGTPDTWSEYRIFTTNDITEANFPKQTKPFITLSIGCQQNFDTRGKPSIVEQLMNKEGGAVATFAAAGFGLLSEGNGAVTVVMEMLLADATRKHTLGSAVLEMKRGAIDPLPTFDDFYRRLSILGDPALRIPLQTLVSVEQKQLERETALQTAPNPTSGETAISYTLAQPATTRVEVFNLAGERVWASAPRTLPAGRHTERVDASAWASGAYLYRVVIGSGLASTAASSNAEQTVGGTLYISK